MSSTLSFTINFRVIHLNFIDNEVIFVFNELRLYKTSAALKLSSF